MQRSCKNNAVEIQLDHGLGDSRLALAGLLSLLPQLIIDKEGNPSVDNGTDILSQITEDADVAAAAISLGMSAVGKLLAEASPELGGSISQTTLEAVGWLYSELGAASAHVVVLSAKCRAVGQANCANTPQINPS